jgi:hypothetical protein
MFLLSFPSLIRASVPYSPIFIAAHSLNDVIFLCVLQFSHSMKKPVAQAAASEFGTDVVFMHPAEKKQAFH